MSLLRAGLRLTLCFCFVLPGALRAVESSPADSTLAPPRDSASAEPAEKWDVANPGLPCDTLSFEASEGTWISVDVSPDGESLAFDLLGDLYTVPIQGGEAKLLSGGLPYEIQPRYSPDGRFILFTSDRGGADNLWIMKADGTEPRQLTKENYRLLNNGVWHPSGDYVVAKKHFTSRRSMGAGEMWMYHVPEGGGGVQLTEKKNAQQDANEPAFSPDGRYLYWSEDMSPGPSFEYNKDPNGTIFVIRRLDRETGRIDNLIERPGGAVRPEVSPDGRTIAFVRRERNRSVLSLFDLATGEVRSLWDGLSLDQQETWTLFGAHPGFDWTPDGRSIVISAQGKLHRVEVASGQVTEIPFHAAVRQPVIQAVRRAVEVGEDHFDVRVIRWAQFTPDGRTVVFQALGKLYRRDLAAPYGQPSGPARRITRDEGWIESAPSLAPDGRTIAYTTWNDREGGRVRVVGIDGTGGRVVQARPGHYAEVAFSSDGRWLVYQAVGGDGYRGYLWAEEAGVYRLAVDGRSPAELVTREGSSPHFNHDGTRIFLNSGEGEKHALVSVNLLGSDRRVHATSERALDFVLSPDERWIAFQELWQTYVAPFPLSARPVELAPEMSNLPVRRLSADGGVDLSWTRDGRRVSWSLGPNLWCQEPDSLFVEREKSAPAPRPDSVALGWTEPADLPTGDLYLVGGRVLPMTAEGPYRDSDRTAWVIDNGVVHVRGNRIVAVGPATEVAIPRTGARVIDVTGMTVMPGFVDVHAHTGSSGARLLAQTNWALMANLAFGVTTTHDPSNNTEMIFAESELQQRGDLLAPRIMSTGTILYGAEGEFKAVIDTYDDALRALRRTAAWGAFSVKSYNQPRREQRQMVIKAARELGMLVVPEGGSTLHYNMSHFLDGHTTLEHAVPVAPLYEPELRLMSRFGTGYTPTLIVGYGGIWGENYWYHHTEVWKDERLLRFMPRSTLDARARRRVMAPEEEYHHLDLARTAAEVERRGGNVEIGAHGQIQGLGVHWELWMLEQGGLEPIEALRCGTRNGARALGLDGSLGTLADGKLADLIVIEGDPLTEIRSSVRVRYTMLNGRLYDARTLEQLAPTPTPAPTLPYLEPLPAAATHFDCDWQME
ncbi:MAG: PD40 domain-containing protein [Candidatus Eisenbacteria bacterium]|nr:PD40 domain-containing protein [Candidatus Eisenbacteria bacterium]